MREHDMLTGFETKIYRKVRLFGQYFDGTDLLGTFPGRFIQNFLSQPQIFRRRFHVFVHVNVFERAFEREFERGIELDALAVTL
jgi:hypothetical protein